jgi:hypothetical protein
MVADVVGSCLVGSCSGKSADVVEKTTHVVGDVMAALLGADRAPKPGKELIGRISDVVANFAQTTLGALLGGDGTPVGGDGTPVGGDGTPAPTDNAVRVIGDVVANLSQRLREAFGVLLLGPGETPNPASNPMAQPLALHWYSERTTELTERVGDAVSNLAQATGGALSGGGSPDPTHKPFTPPVVPLLPAAPGGPAPASYSSFLGASGSSTDAFQLLFFVLFLLLAALLQGGKLSWHRGEPLKPHSALRLAVERPG